MEPEKINTRNILFIKECRAFRSFPRPMKTDDKAYMSEITKLYTLSQRLNLTVFYQQGIIHHRKREEDQILYLSENTTDRYFLELQIYKGKGSGN